MTVMRITRQGACVHISCEGARWSKGLCRNHYEQLNRPNWRRGVSALAKPQRPAKQKALTAKEKLGFDPDDFWEFVKAELRITGSKINFESLPRR